MDTIETRSLGTVDGFDITARIVPDTDTSADDYDCYTEEQIAAWRRDEWSYVGTIVTASKAGLDLGESSLWASEYGHVGESGTGWISPLDGDGDSFVNGYGPDLIAEAIADAKAVLTELAK